jgi:hypothetical protein
MLLGLLSVKLFNDAMAAGYTDLLASSMDVAVRAMNGGPSLACLLDNDMIPFSNIMTVLENPYIDGVSIGGILAGPGLRADKAQAIFYQLIDDGYYDKVVGALTYGAPSATISSSTTLTAGINRYNYLYVAPGVTLTLGYGPGILIANTISNLGTIASGWTRGAGGSPAVPGAGAGGAGCGAVIILARSITIGTITSDGAAGGAGSTVTGSGVGGAGAGGSFWLISGDSLPKGGDGGSAGVGRGLGNPNGGGGGGYASTTKGGDGGSATTTTYSTGLDLLKELLKCVVDWWLVNVAGKTPTTTKSIPSLGGSGGGGGGASDTNCAGGGGGGGGGQIIIYGTSVTAGTVQAKGGAGGNGGTEGSYDAGGGGGGGGIIYVFYKSLTGAFTYNVSGGAGGTGDYAGAAGGTGVFRATAV